jgi:outer membrane protein TolC
VPAAPAGTTLPGPAPAQPAVKALPISLDAVLHIAEEQNAQLALARERVHEAYAAKDVADLAWLPTIYVGTSYYRHEGGIQNEDGTLQHSSYGALFAGLEVNAQLDLREVAYQRINAERKIWQQKGELSRVTNETLLDAASTYLDLLAARAAEAVARDLEAKQLQLLDRAQRIAETDPVGKLQVEAIRSEVALRRQGLLKVRQQGDAAMAKLAYLLGADPCCVELVPVDERLAPIALVDATPPLCDLVARALAEGPGVQEMEGLLALVHGSLERAQGPAKFVPILEMRMLEGAFGAGPGASLDWDNRWDLGLQARWNLTEFLTARRQQQVARSKLEQLHLSYNDLRGKLTSGVQEAREAILSGEQQMRLVEDQVRHAREAYRRSDERLKEEVRGGSIADVLQALRGVELAELNSVSVINAYDKAQLRLMLLLGPGACARK